METKDKLKQKESGWSEPSRGYANRIGTALSIQHVATKKLVRFHAFLDSFEDSWEQEWKELEAFGRMDKIPTYARTVRKIKAVFNIPSESAQRAKQNLAKFSKLVQFGYPVFEDNGNFATHIVAPPILRMKYANWIVNPLTYADVESEIDNSDDEEEEKKKKRRLGLLGYLRGISFSPDLTAGTHTEGGMLYPHLYKLNFDYIVLHEHLLGYGPDKKLRKGGNRYPYLLPTEKKGEVAKGEGVSSDLERTLSRGQFGHLSRERNFDVP